MSGHSDPIPVWIIEDNQFLRDTVSEVVDQAEGMECTVKVGSCEEALAELDAGHPPRVVLMDLGLPGMDGVEGIRSIKSRSPYSDVIVLTIHEEDDRVFQALCAGAGGYLLKPASGRRIVRAIRTTVKGGAPMNAFVARKVLDTFNRISVPRNDFGLTDREREILQLLADDTTQKGMAKALFLSPHTVDTHLRNIYAKLQVHSRTGAVAKAFREGLL